MNRAVGRLDHAEHQVFGDAVIFELDRALDVLEELGQKYSLLLLARDGDIVPVIADDWKAIRVPWER